MEHEDIIKVASAHIPEEYRDDAIQAGYIGLLKGLKNIGKASDNPRGYLYKCVTNEMIKEVGLLHKPFALNSRIFSRLIKYKKNKSMGLNKLVDLELEKLLAIKQWSYSQDVE